MEISLSTEVSDILNHADVINELDAVCPKIKNIILERWQTIKAQMAYNQGLGESQTIDGDPIFYNKANEIALEYTMGFWSDFDWFITLIKEQTYEKEAEELHELQRILNESNSNSETSDSQKKINNDKLSEITTRINKLKESINNDEINDWNEGWADSFIESNGLNESSEKSSEPQKTQTETNWSGRFDDPDGNKYKL